jgi:hypothetical protein
VWQESPTNVALASGEKFQELSVGHPREVDYGLLTGIAVTSPVPGRHAVPVFAAGGGNLKVDRIGLAHGVLVL